MIAAVQIPRQYPRRKKEGRSSFRGLSNQKSKTFLKSSKHTFLFTPWEETDR